MKVGIKLGKVKKFGIGWCIPHRVVADNAEGWFVRTPFVSNRVKVTQLYRPRLTYFQFPHFSFYVFKSYMLHKHSI